jgi:hypothetical protein
MPLTGNAVDVLKRDEESVAAFSRYQRQAMQEFWGDAPPARVVEKHLAGDPDNAGIDTLRMRQELTPHPRAAVVRGNQDVAFRRGAVLEISGNAPSGTFLVMREGLAEMHDVFEARQQHLTQRDPADRAVLRHAVAAELLHGADVVDRE